jgi:hypothetical protein
MKKFLLKIVKVFFICLVAVSALAGLLDGLGYGGDTENAVVEAPTPTPTPEVELPEELAIVGLSDLKDIVTTENGTMKIIRAVINDSRALSVTATLEDGKVIYIMLSDIPTTKTKVKIGIFGRLKTKTQYDVASIDMFTDTEGYLAIYDSAAGTITDYETGDIIVKWE